MKKWMQQLGRALTVLMMALGLNSFTAPAGGDLIEVYQGDQLLLRQYLPGDKEVKNLAVDADGGKLFVYYGHCGTNGHARQLLLRDGAGKLVKSWSYNDAPGTAKSLMECNLQEVPDLSSLGKGRLFLYYNSKETGEERKIAGVELR